MSQDNNVYLTHKSKYLHITATFLNLLPPWSKTDTGLCNEEGNVHAWIKSVVLNFRGEKIIREDYV